MNDSEIGRMEDPARKVSQAEAPISQHMENIRKCNDSDLPASPRTPQGVRGRAFPLGGERGASDHIYIQHIYRERIPPRKTKKRKTKYICMYIHMCM